MYYFIFFLYKLCWFIFTQQNSLTRRCKLVHTAVSVVGPILDSAVAMWELQYANKPSWPITAPFFWFHPKSNIVVKTSFWFTIPFFKLQLSYKTSNCYFVCISEPCSGVTIHLVKHTHIRMASSLAAKLNQGCSRKRKPQCTDQGYTRTRYEDLYNKGTIHRSS